MEKRFLHSIYKDPSKDELSYHYKKEHSCFMPLNPKDINNGEFEEEFNKSLEDFLEKSSLNLEECTRCKSKEPLVISHVCPKSYFKNLGENAIQDLIESPLTVSDLVHNEWQDSFRKSKYGKEGTYKLICADCEKKDKASFESYKWILDERDICKDDAIILFKRVLMRHNYSLMFAAPESSTLNVDSMQNIDILYQEFVLTPKNKRYVGYSSFLCEEGKGLHVYLSIPTETGMRHIVMCNSYDKTYCKKTLLLPINELANVYFLCRYIISYDTDRYFGFSKSSIYYKDKELLYKVLNGSDALRKVSRDKDHKYFGLIKDCCFVTPVVHFIYMVYFEKIIAKIENYLSYPSIHYLILNHLFKNINLTIPMWVITNEISYKNANIINKADDFEIY